MRSSILTLIMLPALMVTFSEAKCFPADPVSQSYGFSSEDWGGGSYLGVDTRDITSDRLSALHLKEERGVEITMVDQDAPAGKAGLKEQDVILTLNGSNVESVEQLRRMIHEIPSGREVSLGISRSGQPMTVKVQLADRKKAFSYSYSSNDNKSYAFSIPPLPKIPDIDVPVSIVMVHSSMRSGLMVENLTPQLGDFFGAKNGQGVLVRSVEKGSRADKAGFRAGDIIVRINGEAVHDSSDFSHALRSRKDNTASVSIIRDKKEQTINMTLPERSQSEEMRESFEMPDFEAETEQMSELKSEMAQLKPQLSQAIDREMNVLRPAIQQELRKQMKDAQKQMQDVQKQFHDHQLEFQKELHYHFHHMGDI
jgi:membrane-associated protease RseP (regulator of RpoE activity)